MWAAVWLMVTTAVIGVLAALGWDWARSAGLRREAEAGLAQALEASDAAGALAGQAAALAAYLRQQGAPQVDGVEVYDVLVGQRWGRARATALVRAGQRLVPLFFRLALLQDRAGEWKLAAVEPVDPEPAGGLSRFLPVPDVAGAAAAARTFVDLTLAGNLDGAQALLGGRAWLSAELWRPAMSGALAAGEWPARVEVKGLQPAFPLVAAHLWLERGGGRGHEIVMWLWRVPERWRGQGDAGWRIVRIDRL